MLGQENGDITHEGNVAYNAPDDVLFPVQVVLAPSIQLRVVGKVVVAPCQKLERRRPRHAQKSQTSASHLAGEKA